ncbi:MAG: hypothetical protein WDO68_23575 [Gammaproteobacteria bacterium]
MKQNHPDSPPPPLHLIAAEGGVAAPPAADRDPYELLDSLMVVVEALCPTWPERENFNGTEKFKL